jgi:transposase
MQQLDSGPNEKPLKYLGKNPEFVAQKLELTEVALSQALRTIYEMRGEKLTDLQLGFVLQEQLAGLEDQLYGSSSERWKKPIEKKKEEPKAPPQPRVKKPSERYPNIPVREVVITQTPAPHCDCCGKEMRDSGMTEDSEQLTVIPKKYEIVLQKQVKFRCSCQGSIVTSAAPERIIPGSSYSDEMIVDVALSKYCDLIPMERYSAMAARGGLVNLPPHSLIELTHQYADFIAPVYERIQTTVFEARVLHADETPHRMLEGSDKKSWYLWGFSTPEACFLECHDTRSGDVASEVLRHSLCEVLVSDVYSGYGKAVRLANAERQKLGLPPIKNANCNAHARRYFFQSEKKGYKEAAFYLDQYQEIYRLNKEAKGKPPPEVTRLREQMAGIFKDMQERAELEKSRYPDKSKYGRALGYFLDNYVGLTLFLKDPEIAIDNNSQESLLRSPVVGRKTWYGTHSKRGALTSAILFTVVESCKLVQVNPREYFAAITRDLLAGKPAYTPHEFKLAQAAVVTGNSTAH